VVHTKFTLKKIIMYSVDGSHTPGARPVQHIYNMAASSGKGKTIKICTIWTKRYLYNLKVSH